MFQIFALRKTPRIAKCVAAFTVSATCILIAGCSSEAGDFGGQKIAAADRTVTAQFAQASSGLVQSAPINSLTGSAVRQRFFSVPRPAELTAFWQNETNFNTRLVFPVTCSIRQRDGKCA